MIKTNSVIAAFLVGFAVSSRKIIEFFKKFWKSSGSKKH